MKKGDGLPTIPLDGPEGPHYISPDTGSRTPDTGPRRLFDVFPREGLVRLHEVLHLALQLQFFRSRRRRWRRLVGRDAHVAVILEALARIAAPVVLTIAPRTHFWGPRTNWVRTLFSPGHDRFGHRDHLPVFSST